MGTGAAKSGAVDAARNRPRGWSAPSRAGTGEHPSPKHLTSGAVLLPPAQAGAFFGRDVLDEVVPAAGLQHPPDFREHAGRVRYAAQHQ